MVYEAEQDPLCYPGTNVLRNKFDITDQAELDQLEHGMFLARAADPLPAGEMDFAHYRAIHRHLFQDAYDWAGELRSVRIAKGGNWFCYPEYIKTEAAKLFGWLVARDHLTGLSAQQFAAEAAQFISELNAIHTFREGNGRTQLIFLKLLTARAGYTYNDAALDPTRTLDAMIASFAGDLGPLEALIADIIA